MFDSIDHCFGGYYPVYWGSESPMEHLLFLVTKSSPRGAFCGAMDALKGLGADVTQEAERFFPGLEVGLLTPQSRRPCGSDWSGF